MTTISSKKKDQGTENEAQTPLVLPKPRGDAKSSFLARGQRVNKKANKGALLSRPSSVLKSIMSRNKNKVGSTTTTITNTSKKSFLYTMLNPRSHQWPAVWFKGFIATVIVADFLIFVAATEPKVQAMNLPFFDIAEGVVASIFMLEYLARLLTVTESKKYAELGPIGGRVQFIISFSATIDLMSSLPYFLEQASGLDLPKLTVLRILRLLRILKTNGFVRAIDAVWRVIFHNREILFVALFVGLSLILVTSLLMYVLRPSDSEEFQSILSTMYLSTLMLTGQGGPEEDDMPWYTKGVVLLTGLFSIGMFAIPASMLTWGFEAEAERLAKRSRQLSRTPTRIMNHDSDSWSSSGDDYSTDEEYLKIISGEGDDEEDDTDPVVDEATRIAIAKFLQADDDRSGSISMEEFLQYVRRSSSNPSGGSGGETRPDALPRTGTAAAATGKAGPVMKGLEERMTALEAKVDTVVDKVDRLCQLIETQNHQLKEN